MNNNPFLLPIGIFIAALIVGASVFFVTRDGANTATTVPEGTIEGESVPPLRAGDHIRGNPNAPVVIIEYSDFECPFCKNFQITMQRIMEDYGKEGQVAWVYRHFPIEELHSKAPTQALASECVAELGGNEAFWRFADELYETTPSNDLFDLGRLPGLAESAGVNRIDFDLCMKDGALMAHVEQEFEEAVNAKAIGTPFSVIYAGDQIVPVAGAQPYIAMKTAIDTALNTLGTRERGSIESDGGMDSLYDPSQVPPVAEVTGTTSPTAGGDDAPTSTASE